jgi:type I restriction enzyme S subunit
MKLPDSWIETTVGKVIIDMQPGFAQRPGDEDSGSTPQIRTHNVSPDGKITLEGIKHVTVGSKELEKYRLKKGDVVFNNTNSEEWVGKTAVFDQEGVYVFSNHMTRLRTNQELILPEYLAVYLHLLWAMGYSKTRAKRWVSQAGIEGSMLLSFKIQLPAIQEQQRIVDLLNQLKEVVTLRVKFDDLLIQAKRQIFEEIFGNPNPRANTRWPIVKLGSVVTVATGGTPPREQADSFGGSIAWVKSTDLTDTPIIKTDESVTELGIQRSNARVYPKNTIMLAMYGQGQTRGRTGKLLIEASCNQACAALLPNEELLPDYLWVWLQLSYDAVRSLGRGGQQENLNLDIIRNIKLPKPPVDLQRTFSERLGQLLEIVKNAEVTKQQTEVLISALRIDALTGTATAQWREKHALEIQKEVLQRDELLHNITSKPHKAEEPDDRSQPAAPKSVRAKTRDSAPSQLSKPAEHGRPARYWLLNELSEFQGAVWTMLQHEWRNLVIVDDPEAFNDFCTNEQTTWPIEHFNASPNRIRRTLEQLAGLGLIAKVSVLRQNAVTQQTEYLTAFRPLRDDENTRLRDAAMLKNAIDSNETSSGNLEE